MILLADGNPEIFRELTLWPEEISGQELTTSLLPGLCLQDGSSETIYDKNKE